jgi:Holliday junction DNA helicase RuvA
MISRIRGVVREIRELQLLLEVNGICYEVSMPASLLRILPDRLSSNGELELVTFHYQQLEVGRGIPVLIGFFNEVEREFFVRFISVAGIGPRAALKALTLPIAVIAQAIDEADLTLLQSLPGIGVQRAKEIVAKLQGKVGKYALIQAKEALPETTEAGETAIEEEAIAVLIQLEYKKVEAKDMVRTALERNPKVRSSEELLNEVYRQQRLATEAGATT